MADTSNNIVTDTGNNVVHPVFTTRGITLTDTSKFATNSGKLKIVDHGDWVVYNRVLSDAEKKLLPSGVVFLKRTTDDVDWYEYSRNPKNFAASSVLAMASPDGNDYSFTIQVATADRSNLTPAFVRVFEILNYKGTVEDIQNTFARKVYTPFTKEITDKPVDLKAFAANLKYETETGGITVNGYPVSTDRQSQSMMTSTVLSLQLAPNTVVNWKGPDGNFTVLTREAITGIALLTMQHVATCFSVEAEVDKLIDSKDITTPEQVTKYFKDNVNTVFTTPKSA
jgi:hypothetical protein